MKITPAARRRIRRTREIQQVLNKGRRVRGERLQLHLLRQGGSEEIRLGVSARRRLGNAVARNRSKRLIKEAFRLRYQNLPPGTDIVVAVLEDLSGMKLREVDGLLWDLILKSGLTLRPTGN